MAKLKTLKGAKKRFKVTGTGKVLGWRPGRRHLLGGRRAKIKRQLRRPQLVSGADKRKVRALLPYA
jgi:large subunit ribosomal protein L35